MIHGTSKTALFVSGLVLMVNAWAQQAGDHPLIGRFEQSQIINHETTSFDEYVLLTQRYTGSAEWGESGKEQFGRTLEGKVTRITYESPKTTTTLKVMRAYQEALADEGFETLFECDDDACGGRDFSLATIPYDIVMSGNYEDQRYLAVRKSRPEKGDAYAAIYTVKAYGTGGERKDRVYTQVDVIEEQPRRTGVVVIEANEMAQQIDQSGRVALYGLYFDTDKATIKPDSKPTLDEIGKLLQSKPSLKLLVVGHTDNQGGFEYNIDLSKRRAASVTEALVNDYGIERDRLKPWGVGYTAPVASNAAKEGRAKNRRVELVAR